MSHKSPNLPINYFNCQSFESIIEYPVLINPINGYFNNQYPNNSLQSSLINYVGIYRHSNDNESIDNDSITKEYSSTTTSNIHANIPLFFHHNNKIKIPTKIEFALRRYTPRALLRDVHPDIDIAVELCLLFVSQLTSTYFDIRCGYNPEGWKSLNSRYLRDLLSTDPLTYKKARIALEYPLKTGSILICDYLSNEGLKSYHHRLGDAYVLRGVKTYELKTPTAIRLLNKRFMRTYDLAITNPICRNLIELYPNITLPSQREIIQEAKRLIELGYKTKKGKKLTFLNKHSRSYFKNPEQLSFVEDAIQIFEYLTDNGLMIPVEGSPESGGRVVDSFTLMPSWIRRLVKIDGKNFIEVDYSCLHPNIAMKIYGGKMVFLSHDEVAKKVRIDIDLVKVEHLSFFNKKIWQMKKSPLYQYYIENEPKMMEGLVNEKKNSPLKHKITSKKMFEAEVGVMSEVINQLNQEGIYLGYVYDALFCNPQHADRVKEIMDDIVLKHGIKTSAKFSNEKKYNPSVELFNEMKFENTNSGSTIYSSSTTTTSTVIINFREVNHNVSTKKEVLLSSNEGSELSFSAVFIDFEDGEFLPERVIKIYDEYSPSQKYMTHRFLFGTEN